MFSFFNLDRYNGGCCTYQTKTYLKYGQARGLSPQDYMERLTNFDSTDKRLVHVNSVYVPELCLNVINKLSFGRGTLLFTGGQMGTPFGIYIHSDQKWHIFDYVRIRTYLTFQWFKQNVVCTERPLICMRSQ